MTPSPRDSDDLEAARLIMRLTDAPLAVRAALYLMDRERYVRTYCPVAQRDAWRAYQLTRLTHDLRELKRSPK